MNTILAYLFIISLPILAVLLWAATKPRRTEEFDGGFSAMNSDVYITRIKADFTETKGRT